MDTVIFKAILIIWTVTADGVFQTSTPITTMEACGQAKEMVEKVRINRSAGRYDYPRTTVLCIER